MDDGTTQAPWVEALMSTGRLLRLGVEPPTLEEVMRSLPQINRWTGQTSRPLSVAEHCLWCDTVATLLEQPIEARRAVLLHDAAESVLGDISRPVKRLVRAAAGSVLDDLERSILRAFGEANDVDFDTHAELIRRVDNAVLFLERDWLLPCPDSDWHGEAEARELLAGLELSLVGRDTMPAWWAERLLRDRAGTLGLPVEHQPYSHRTEA